MKKRIAMFLAFTMAATALMGCQSGETSAKVENGTGTESPSNTSGGADVSVKEAPMLAELIASGELEPLEERIPVKEDVFVDTTCGTEGVYGGTLQTNDGDSMWYYGPITEEPLVKLQADGSVLPNVAKSYEVSEDGLTYTIKLREGMKWSDGEPFTAEDCVYYYNYMLVSDVDEEYNVSSYVTRVYNWYKTVDPADGISKPAIVKYVDDTTFTIQLYAPKPTLMANICIDNKWMFAPKHWYKDIVAYDPEKPHWSGETDLKKLGGEGLEKVTQEEAVENAKERNPEIYNFDNYDRLGEELGYRYWQYLGRPTLRAWVAVSKLTDSSMVFERNPYFWKVDEQGRQLPYIDKINFQKMDPSLYVQEMVAGNFDMAYVNGADFTKVKVGETDKYKIAEDVTPNWSTLNLQLNQTYKDEQYRALFENIDFRHALSIGANRSEMSDILTNGMDIPAQVAAPEGTKEYIEGAPEKWIEYNVEEANALLDGIDSISKSTELNADGYRTFTDGARKGEAITIEIATVSDDKSANAVALLAKYYKDLGIQITERGFSDRTKRAEMVVTGTELMSILEEIGMSCLDIALRPDYMAPMRENSAWYGQYGTNRSDKIEPKAGSEMEKLVESTNQMYAARTEEEMNEATSAIVQNHADNTWMIGYLNNASAFTLVSNHLHNVREYVSCDELRFIGLVCPYTWYLTK